MLLLDFLLNGRGNGRVADVGIDLHQKIATDDHRLGFRVIDISGNDRAPARNLVADKFRGHEFGDRRAKAISGMNPDVAVSTVLQRLLSAEIFANRDYSISGVMRPFLA